MNFHTNILCSYFVLFFLELSALNRFQLPLPRSALASLLGLVCVCSEGLKRGIAAGHHVCTIPLFRSNASCFPRQVWQFTNQTEILCTPLCPSLVSLKVLVTMDEKVEYSKLHPVLVAKLVLQVLRGGAEMASDPLYGKFQCWSLEVNILILY